MKTKKILLVLGASILLLLSCKMIGRAAAKYWTNKQIKEFVGNCEAKAGPFVGEDKAKQYCDCAVDIIAEEYQNYDKAKNISIPEVIRLAKACK